MSEDKEKISAWLDDAIQYNELDSLEIDSGKHAFSTAARYQVIGDALRGRVADAAMIDVSASVREAIRQEGPLVSTHRPASAAQRERKPLFDFGAWLRPVSGLAVAATVAMVMVVTLTDQQTETNNPTIANVGQQPVQSLPVNNTVPAYGRPGLATPAVNLNTYVKQHSEFAAQDTIQGLMPYARSVSYGLDSKPSLKNTNNQSQIVNNPGQ
jgi:negative regulator of sigma E activity